MTFSAPLAGEDGQSSTCEEDPAGFLCYVDASRIYYVDASL
jgi:hypothetical protein